MIDLLSCLQRSTQGAMALISGRRLDDLDRLFAPLRLDGAGIHGAEWRIGGESYQLNGDLHEVLSSIRPVLHGLASKWPGVVIEDKTLATAIHFRNAPQAETVVARTAKKLLDRLGPAFRLQTGADVVELVPTLATKGAAIARLMSSPPFQGRLPIFAGDDITDESGFKRVQAAGGHAILVGPPRATAAGYRLPSVADFRQWLWDGICPGWKVHS